MQYLFYRCPVCGYSAIHYERNRRWHCTQCGFILYKNIATAVGLIICMHKNGKKHVLFIKRSYKTHKGLYTLPGGFVDHDESAEEAARRICFEETGLTILNLHYICSAPNAYMFKNIEYKTCDLFFEADVPLENSSEHFVRLLRTQNKHAINGYRFFSVNCNMDIAAIPMVFPTASHALKTWLTSC